MQEIHVVGAAIIQDFKLLAARRSKIMSNPLKWEFAGGKVEKGESHSAALKREIQEELGVEIKVNDFIASGHSIAIDKHIILHVYKAELIKGEPRPKEHAELKWLEISNIGELDWAEADIPACIELQKKYCNKS